MTSLSGLPLPRDRRAGTRSATTSGHRDRPATDRDTEPEPEVGTELAGFTLARLAVATVALLLICQVLALPSVLGWALLAAGTTVTLLPCARWATAFAGAGVVWSLGTGFWTNRFGTL